MSGQAYETAPKSATITEKAQRVLELGSDLLERCLMLEERLYGPTPEKNATTIGEKPPDALPWILESAEGRLRRVLEVLNRTIERI